MVHLDEHMGSQSHGHELHVDALVVHFGMGLSLFDLATFYTFDDAWRMSLLAYK